MTQLPRTVSDTEILALDRAGVRAIRFNLQRDGSEQVHHLVSVAARIHELAGWHVELYVDAANLEELQPVLLRLPAVSIDHLGLSRAGLPRLSALAEQGVKVKASGFGRLDFDAAAALRGIHAANPGALMFGTDLPSTRAPRAYAHTDFLLVVEALGEAAAQRVFSGNALDFYRLRARLE